MNKQNVILKGIEENKKLLLKILEKIENQESSMPSLSYDKDLNSYVSNSSENNMHCDIDRCKKTDAKHYRVRLPDGNGNLEIVEKNYCSAHFGEARAKGVEVVGI